MSTKSSFREALEQVARTRGATQTNSDSDGVRVLLRNTGIQRPIEVALALKTLGLSLRKAHDVIDRLARGTEVASHFSIAEGSTSIEQLASLGVQASLITVPRTIDVKALRTRLGLSQVEFATRFALEVDSVRNWEQGRNIPDRSALVLLSVIASNPTIVDQALGATGFTGVGATAVTATTIQIRATAHNYLTGGYLLQYTDAHLQTAPAGFVYQDLFGNITATQAGYMYSTTAKIMPPDGSVMTITLVPNVTGNVHAVNDHEPIVEVAPIGAPYASQKAGYLH